MKKLSVVKWALVALALAGIPATALAQSEGIKVHGRWVIEIQNPDGTIAQRREFNNALSNGGAQLLATLLGRTFVPSRWEVGFTAPFGGVSPCQGGTGATSPNWCKLIELAATDFTGGNAESRNLVVTPIVTGLGSSVRMTGSIEALTDGSIGAVSTRLGGCPASTLIADCNGSGGSSSFSDATLGFPGYPPVVSGIVAGQIIKITVTFTFS